MLKRPKTYGDTPLPPPQKKQTKTKEKEITRNNFYTISSYFISLIENINFWIITMSKINLFQIMNIKKIYKVCTCVPLWVLLR